MLKKVSFAIREARYKLKRLGMVLFYIYLLLALLGCVGIVFGVYNLLLKMLGGAVTTRWDELITLTLISGYMIKFFLRESIGLIETDKTPPAPDRDEEVIEVPPASTATIIAFKRKP